MIIKPILPWEYRLLAFVADPGHITPDTALIITERDAHPHQYVLHRMNLHTGDCYYGHYHETYASALEALVAKLGVGNDAPVELPPLPDAQFYDGTTDEHRGYVDGWNDCLHDVIESMKGESK